MPSTSIYHESERSSIDLTELRRRYSEPGLEAARDSVNRKSKTNGKGNQVPLCGSSERQGLRQHRDQRAGDRPSVLRNRYPLNKRVNKTSEQRLKVFEDLRNELDTLGGEHCIFLCWTDQDSKTWALPVLFKDPEDEVQIYLSLRHGWLERPRTWRSKLLFRGVSAVTEIRVVKQIIWQSDCSFS